MANKELETIANALPSNNQLPTDLQQAIEQQIENNQLYVNGSLFLDQNVSDKLNSVLKNQASISYFSNYLNRYILLVGYYAQNFQKMQQEDEKVDEKTSNFNRKTFLKHVYFSMSLVTQSELDVNALEATIQNKTLYNEQQKAQKRLEKILDAKAMNSQGYIFLTENERDEIGKEFLLAHKKIHLPAYVRNIEIGGVQFEVEEAMEKRFRDYSFDALNKYERLTNIIYPVFADTKIKEHQYKAGLQTVDKKQMPLYLWTFLMCICFMAAIGIIIWVFGYVVPSVKGDVIFSSENPPVDGAMVIQSLFPNAWTFLSHVAASITIFLFMFFFAWKPCKRMVENRAKYISDQIEGAEMKNKEADIKLAYAAKVELESFLKTTEMIEEAVRTSNLKREAIEKEAKADAESIRNAAQQDVLLMHQKMEKEIKEEIANNSIQIASALLKRNVSSQDNQQFVNDFITNLDNIK